MICHLNDRSSASQCVETFVTVLNVLIDPVTVAL